MRPDQPPEGRIRHWEITAPRNRRLAPELYAMAGQACFFTVRCWPDSAPFADDTLAAVAVECLLGQQTKSSCQVDVYCVMPDHVHLVVTPLCDGASSLTYVDRFKGWCGRMLRLAGWRGEVWQARSYDHLVRRDEDLAEIAAYILANPVRKGLCDDPGDYRWSGVPEGVPYVAPPQV
ncbi:MAG TPA: transposase [Chloroflexota bacterium]|nr:transposase [Chloroflexota bacterium]